MNPCKLYWSIFFLSIVLLTDWKVSRWNIHIQSSIAAICCIIWILNDVFEWNTKGERVLEVISHKSINKKIQIKIWIFNQNRVFFRPINQFLFFRTTNKTCIISNIYCIWRMNIQLPVRNQRSSDILNSTKPFHLKEDVTVSCRWKHVYWIKQFREVSIKGFMIDLVIARLVY